VLVAARDAKVRRVVYAASSSAYGDTPTLPKHEAMTPNPISPYAVAKLAGEHYMTSFYRCYGLETVSLRYFNIFGPYQDPTSPYSGVLAKFITSMLSGQEPTIFGDGEQSRDLLTSKMPSAPTFLRATPRPLRSRAKCGNVATGTRLHAQPNVPIAQKPTGYSGGVIVRARPAKAM